MKKKGKLFDYSPENLRSVFETFFNNQDAKLNYMMLMNEKLNMQVLSLSKKLVNERQESEQEAKRIFKKYEKLIAAQDKKIQKLLKDRRDLRNLLKAVK